MAEFLTPVIDFINNTQVLDQIRDVEVKALFTNPWFMVPFVLQIGWWLYKQAVNSLVITGLVTGLWWFSGSRFTQDLIINGEMQPAKIFPVVGVGIVVIVVLAYLFFIRSD